MAIVSANFDLFTAGSAVTGTGQWLAAPAAVGTVNTTEIAPPAVAQDSTGLYLGHGQAVLADGDLLPEGPITRVSAVVELGVNGLARLILPYAGRGDDGDQFMEVEVRRIANGQAALSIYLTDPGILMDATPALHLAVAHASPGTDATAAGWLTAECGPRYLRAWWGAGAALFVRRTPDLGAFVPAIDTVRWGVMGAGAAKIRAVQIDTDPTFRLRNARRLLSVDADTPDTAVPLTGSTARLALARYTVGSSAKRRRGRVLLTVAGDGSTGRLADHRCNRLDGQRTLVPCPSGLVVDLRAATVDGTVSGPAGEASAVVVSVDPSGTDGGIGSGRTNMLSGGEMCLDLNDGSQASTITVSLTDWASDTGGQEAYQQISSAPLRTWDLSIKSKPEHARRAELILGFSGGARGVWCLPPQVVAPTPAMISSLDHRQTGPRRLDLSCTLTEL